MSALVMRSEREPAMEKPSQQVKPKESELGKGSGWVMAGQCFPNDAAARSRRRSLLQTFHNALAVFPNPAGPTMNLPFH